MSDIMSLTSAMGVTCLNTTTEGDSYSGQIFVTDSGGYNVVAAYCDGNDPVNTLPSSYVPPGPNGYAPLDCGGNSENPCTLGSCDSGSLVVTSQETVTCNEYLGNNYIGAGEGKSSQSFTCCAVNTSIFSGICILCKSSRSDRR